MMPTLLNAGRWVLGVALVVVVVLPEISGAQSASPAARADTVVVVVSAANPLTEITRLHLADIFFGRTTRLPNGALAEPIDQRSGLPIRAAFSETYLGRSEAQMKAHWSKIIFTGRGRPPTEAPGDAAVRDLVARNPGAIGYLDPRFVDASVRIVRVL